MFQLRGREEIIFDGITWPEDSDILKAGNLTQSLVLYFFGERGGKAVDINLDGIPAFGFNKKLVSVSFCKAIDLVFDAWTIPGTSAFYPSRIHWASIETCF